VPVDRPGVTTASATQVQGAFIRDVMKANLETRNFRIFGPDETTSNRWGAVFVVTGRMWAAEIDKTDASLSVDDRVMVLNDLDRFHLAGDVIDCVPGLGSRMACVKQMLRDKLIEHKEYIAKHGEDTPDVRDWTWE
jgi:phosphoketolase